MTNPPAEVIQPRYTSLPFPAYRFIPGKAPHPTRDPDGHSYNQPLRQLVSFKPGDWQSCEDYLYGIDLFNHRYWWEAHEALEAVWVAVGRRTQTGLFIQGLIQVSVAHLKWSQGFHDTARQMSSEALEKMKHVQGQFMGIEIDAFRSDVTAYFAAATETPVAIKLALQDNQDR